MKKYIFIISLILFQNPWAFSQYQGSKGHITELFFDDADNWTLEIYFIYYDTRDTGYLLVSPTDTALFKKFPGPDGFLVLTQADMDQPFNIRRQGDSLGVLNPMHPLYSFGHLAGAFIWGDFDYYFPFVNAPAPGQSIVGLNDLRYDNYWEDMLYPVIDTVHSPGYLTKPPFGSIEGYVCDSTGTPLPFMRISLESYINVFEEKWIYTDQNGHFRDTALYAKNYYPYLSGFWYGKSEGFTIEPGGSLNKDFTLPVRRDVNVEGTCLLADSANPEGTRIIFDNLCPGVQPDTVYTDNTGHFIYAATTGSYNLWYSRQGYIPFDYMMSIDLYESKVIADRTLSIGQVNEIPSGSISGVWEKGNPYWILGDITVQEGDSLILEPGASVHLTDYCSFHVYGTLVAEGSATERITIYLSTGYYYQGLNFLGELSSGSKLDYVTVQGSEATITIYDSSPLLSNLSFEDFSFYINIYGSSAPFFTDTYSETGSYPDIFIGHSARPVFRNNVFAFTRFYCEGHASPVFEYNDFYYFNRAVQCWDYSKPQFTGNIFFLGDVGIDVNHGSGIDVAKYNSFFGTYFPGKYLGLPGFCELDTVNINGDSCDYYFNITKHPRLVDPENGDFNLQEISPCIDAGDPSSSLDPDSTIADIGALYFNQLAIFIETIPGQPISVNIFPNPASGRINFEIKLPEEHSNSSGFLHFYKSNGIQVRSFPVSIKNDQETDFQTYNLDLESGTYVYRLELNREEISSGKIIIINP